MRGHIGMENTARGVFHHDQDIEQAKSGGDHDTAITGDDRLGMVACQKTSHIPPPPRIGRGAGHPFT